MELSGTKSKNTNYNIKKNYRAWGCLGTLGTWRNFAKWSQELQEVRWICPETFGGYASLEMGG